MDHALVADLQQALAPDRIRVSQLELDLYARDANLFAQLTERIARNRAEIEAAELRWLEVAEMAEALAR